MYIYAVIIIHNGRFRFLPSISSLTLFHLDNNKAAEKPAREHPVITAITDATMIARGSTIHVTAAAVVARVHQ